MSNPKPACSILLVEDDADVRGSLEDVLNKRGYDVTGVGSGRAAVEACTKGQFDIGVLDVMLPDGSGLDRVPQMETLQPGIEILIITGQTNTDLTKAVRPSTVGFLIKPVKVEQFLSVIERIAERQILAKQNRELQAALRESEAELRNLMESTPDGLSVTVDGKIVYCNQALAEMSGYRPEEIVGTSPFDHIPPRDHERAATRLREIALGGASRLAEYTMINKNGREAPVEIFSGRINFGVRPGIVSTIRDITERKRKEEAAKDLNEALESSKSTLEELQRALVAERLSESKYRALINQSPDSVFVSRIDDFTFTEVNDRACADYGYSREEFLTMEIFDIETKAPLRQQVRDLYDATPVGQVVEVDGVNRRKDGSTFPIHVRFTKLDDEFALAVVRDIRERKRAEETLRQAQRDGFILTDLDGTLVDVNPAYCELVGFTREELLCMKIGDLETLLLPGHAKLSIAQIVEQGGATFETTARRKDGRIVELEVSTVVVERGGTQLLAAFARDITERKRLEREVLEISVREQRRIGQDLHDGLGQSLTGIALLSKALAQKLVAVSSPGAADAAEIARLVSTSITQARTLAKGLHPTALATGGLQVALEDLASTTEQLFGVSCVLTADGAASLPDDVATQLYYMAQEAVTNAVKHAEPKNITLALQSAGHTTTLAVEDDGRGFPADGEGAQGMGLHLMRYRAGMINGFLDIRPRSDGGTMVVCSFPTPPTEKRESMAHVGETNER